MGDIANSCATSTPPGSLYLRTIGTWIALLRTGSMMRKWLKSSNERGYHDPHLVKDEKK